MVRIVIDSSSDYFVGDLDNNGIEMVPMTITIGEKEFLDKTRKDRDRFFELLQRTKDMPKTSQPSPQAFLDIFEDAKEKGDQVVCILISTGFSGTYQSAVMAKDMTEYDEIYIIDSRAATYNLKIMADYACRLRNQGMDGAAIAQAVEDMKGRVKCYAVLDTLEYLKRGGRIGKLTAMVGTLAKFKPIITFTEEGTITLAGKVIGKHKAVSALEKIVTGMKLDPEFPFYVIYSYGCEKSDLLTKKLEEDGITVSDVLQIGATIGTHIGPEGVGVICVEAEE